MREKLKIAAMLMVALFQCLTPYPVSASPDETMEIIYETNLTSTPANQLVHSAATCSPGTYVDPNGTETCISCKAGTYNWRSNSAILMQIGAYIYVRNFVQGNNMYRADYGLSGNWYWMPFDNTCMRCNSDGGNWRFTGCGCVGDVVFDVWVAQNQPSDYCYFCDYGYYQPSTGATSCTTQCPFGEYTSGTVPAASCQPCNSVSKCCPRGQYYGGGGNTSCTLCPAGTYSIKYDVEGVSNCIGCPLGQGSDPGSKACTACNPGFYSPGNSPCLPCPSGTYTSPDTYSSFVCTPCPLGTYSTQSASGTTTCTPCPNGTYTNTTGTATCTPCPLGTYSSATGSTNCTACGEDTYADVQGLSACKACNPCPSPDAFLMNCGGPSPGICTWCTNSVVY